MKNISYNESFVLTVTVDNRDVKTILDKLDKTGSNYIEGQHDSFVTEVHITIKNFKETEKINQIIDGK